MRSVLVVLHCESASHEVRDRRQGPSGDRREINDLAGPLLRRKGFRCRAYTHCAVQHANGRGHAE